MAQTILQKWTNTFSSQQNAPDASREKTSNQVNRVVNSLSDRAVGMNNWTSLNPVQSGRYTMKIGLLWEQFLGDSNPIAVASNSIDGGDISLRSAQLGLDTKFEGATYQNKQSAGNAALLGVARNNNIRAKGVTDAINAFNTGGFEAFFKAGDNVTEINAFVKNNYRLAAANPNGVFSNFTTAGFSNEVDGENKTTTLDTLAPTQ